MNSYWHRVTAIITAIVTIIISYLTPLSIEYELIDLGYCFFFFGVGYTFPDSDLWMDFVKHRSALTHSAIFPLIYFLLFRSLASGVFCLIMATHLFGDIGFKPLLGFGRIHAFNKEMGSTKSKLWLLLNGIVCIVIGLAQIWLRL